MDVEKVQREMRVLAESRITRFVGEEQILLTKSTAAKVCNKSVPWVDGMVARGRLPTVRVGERKLIQRPALVEALVNGL